MRLKMMRTWRLSCWLSQGKHKPQARSQHPRGRPPCPWPTSRSWRQTVCGMWRRRRRRKGWRKMQAATVQEMTFPALLASEAFVHKRCCYPSTKDLLSMCTTDHDSGLSCCWPLWGSTETGWVPGAHLPAVSPCPESGRGQGHFHSSVPWSPAAP
nr:unnamed protein product [Homo sapiens]